MWLQSDEACAALPRPAHTAPLTKYEMTVAAAWRAIRLSQGAAPNIAVANEDYDVLEAAWDELQCGVAPPLRIMRYLPDETHVEVDVNSATRPPHVPCHVLP